ncbi:shikimate kinase [Actibacterium lipolyticum]
MVGMMGAGKTAVGTNLAKRLAVPFLDSDEEIEKAADRTIAEIFSRDGEAFFRRKEAQVISRLLESEQCILSTGGGAYLSEDNRAAIADKGVAVWLKADIDLLWNRVRHKTTRPLLNTGNPEKTLRDIYDARVPYYEKCDLQVQALPRYSIDQMTDAVIDALLTRPDVLEKD